MSTLNSQLSDVEHPHIRSAQLEATRVPTILRLNLSIEGQSFEKAEAITDTFVESLKELIEGQTQDSRTMSTGIQPA